MRSLSDIFHYFELFGSILGVHRTYCSQKRTTKYFIIFHVFILIMFHIATCVIDITLFLQDNYGLKHLIYCAFAVGGQVTCLPNLVYAICYSHAFISYLHSMDRISKYFENNKKFKKAMKIACWLFLIVMMFSIVLGVLRALISPPIQTGRATYITVVIFASQIILRIVIMYQYLMCFLTIFLIVTLSKCFHSWMKDVELCIRKKSISLIEPCVITKKLIKEWVEIYQDLANSCVKVAICFGRLYLYSIIILLFYYNLFIYKEFCFNPTQTKTISDLRRLFLVFSTYISVLVMPLVAGQLVINQNWSLLRMVARLHNTMQGSNEIEIKAIKDFIRLMKKYPLEIKLFSKILSGTALLPAVLMLAVNSLIVLLQFNHVI